MIEENKKLVLLSGDAPSAINVLSWCHFDLRCPRDMNVCILVEPTPMKFLGKPACYMPPPTSAS